MGVIMATLEGSPLPVLYNYSFNKNDYITFQENVLILPILEISAENSL